MSLMSAGAAGGGGESANGASASSRRVPLLAASAAHPGAAYAAWRPQMETYLMRAGIEGRDYKVELPQWAELEAAVQSDLVAEEEEGMALLLAGAKAVAGTKAVLASAPVSSAPA